MPVYYNIQDHYTALYTVIAVGTAYFLKTLPHTHTHRHTHIHTHTHTHTYTHTHTHIHTHIHTHTHTYTHIHTHTKRSSIHSTNECSHTKLTNKLYE